MTAEIKINWQNIQAKPKLQQRETPCKKFCMSDYNAAGTQADEFSCKEPPTTGRVVVKTTYGDLDISLWCKEAPRTCRNFLQLILDGYYDGSVVHRIVPGFVVQAGIPVDEGERGICENNDEIPLELHSRIHFVRRGLLATALTADDGKHSVGGQFFFTLDANKNLERKHTIFGKIVGETLFNLLKIADTDLDENERPIFPPKILSIKILEHPFDDLNYSKQRKQTKESNKVEETKRIIIKNRNLLSFDQPDEHDTLQSTDSSTSSLPKSANQLSNQSTKANEKLSTKPIEMTQSQSKSTQIQQEMERVKREILQQEMSKKANTYSNQNIPKKSKLSHLEQLRQQYISKQQSQPKGAEEKEKFLQNELNNFKSKLHSLENRQQKISRQLHEKTKSEANSSNQSFICSLHNLPNCKSCTKTVVSNDDNDNWLNHKLIFDK